MIGYEEMHDLVELYALDALEGIELERFEAHLGECQVCEERLGEALTVTSSLVEDTAPPNHVWDRIVEEIDDSSARIVSFPNRTGFLMGMASIAAAALIGLFAVLVGGETADSGEALAAAAAAAADQPGSTVVDFVVGEVVVAQVVLDEAGSGFVIPTSALPELDQTRTYQLWVINDNGEVISGGVLGHAPGVSTFTWTDGVSGFALTREVAGGVPVSEGDVVAIVSDI